MVSVTGVAHSRAAVVVSPAEEGEEDIETILASVLAKEAEKTAVVTRDAVEPPVRANGTLVRVGDEMVLFGGTVCGPCRVSLATAAIATGVLLTSVVMLCARSRLGIR